MMSVNCWGSGFSGNVGVLNCFTSVQYFRSEAVSAPEPPRRRRCSRPTPPGRSRRSPAPAPFPASGPPYRLCQPGEDHLSRRGQDWPIVLLDGPRPPVVTSSDGGVAPRGPGSPECNGCGTRRCPTRTGPAPRCSSPGCGSSSPCTASCSRRWGVTTSAFYRRRGLRRGRRLLGLRLGHRPVVSRAARRGRDRRQGRPLDATTALDTGLILAFAAVTGASHSPVVPLAVLDVMAAAIRFDLRRALVVTGIATAGRRRSSSPSSPSRPSPAPSGPGRRPGGRPTSSSGRSWSGCCPTSSTRPGAAGRRPRRNRRPWSAGRPRTGASGSGWRPSTRPGRISSTPSPTTSGPRSPPWRPWPGPSPATPSPPHRRSGTPSSSSCRATPGHLGSMLAEVREVAVTESLSIERQLDLVDVYVPELIWTAGAAAAIPHERLVLDIEAGLNVLRTDSQKLQRIIANLLENSFRHSPPDSPLEVRIRRTARAPGWWSWPSSTGLGNPARAGHPGLREVRRVRAEPVVGPRHVDRLPVRLDPGRLRRRRAPHRAAGSWCGPVSRSRPWCRAASSGFPTSTADETESRPPIPMAISASTGSTRTTSSTSMGRLTCLPRARTASDPEGLGHGQRPEPGGRS